MLGTLLDSLQGVKRLIFVGDHAQLPPIGAGRPFVDIVSKLRPSDNESRFPRVAPGYAELTIERRQIGIDRPDLRLARWFSSTPPSVGEDDIFSAEDSEHKNIRFVKWDTLEEIQPLIINILKDELKISKDDHGSFDASLGAFRQGDYSYFNATRDGKDGSVHAIEDWQILTPLRGMPFGTGDINTHIHQTFRAGFVDLASKPPFQRRIPKPFGPEMIVYGDKVINLRNHRRDGKKVYPSEGAVGYLANGEIGIVVGQWKTQSMKGPPKIVKVEFSSQTGYTYDFYAIDFKEEGEPALELAYALTVHKAQGSQFQLVFLIVPEHKILSRELIYTALTRHKNRIVILHQGTRGTLKGLTDPHQSETARRQTNLLADCSMVEFFLPKGSVFLQEGLIHRTSRGMSVRSKSELLIAEALISAGIEFEYEKPLTLSGHTRYPDFTIDDEISGRVIYWEHLGMLDRNDYKNSWNKKLAWYRKHNIFPPSEAKDGCPILITTDEIGSDGFNMQRIKKIIKDLSII